jgi:arginase family enzyme
MAFLVEALSFDRPAQLEKRLRYIVRIVLSLWAAIASSGGDCLIDLAPIAYLNTRYGGNLGVLWVDAHPDVLTPKNFAQGNAQVLGALLGKRGFRSGRRGQNACKSLARHVCGA